MDATTIAAIVGATAAVGTLGVSIYNAVQTRVMKVEVDGRMTQLLALNKTSAHAAGVKQEREREQKD